MDARYHDLFFCNCYIFFLGYGVTSDGFTKFINASTCNLMYKATNPPIVFDFPIPNGHSKDEIETIPSCNLGETYSV